MIRSTIAVRFTFTETILGCASGNKDIHKEFIASKAPTPELAAEEVAAIPDAAKIDEQIKEETEKAMTVYHRDENGLFVFDYHLLGFFKEQLAVLADMSEVKISKWSVKKVVGAFVRINPRRIYLMDATGKPYKEASGTMQRPLRAETMQGERIALASSETLPPGTTLQFMLTLLSGKRDGEKKSKTDVLTIDDLKAALDFGSERGFLQWRSGGWGRFTWTEVPFTPTE
jgi:hypothetical protein